MTAERLTESEVERIDRIRETIVALDPRSVAHVSAADLQLLDKALGISQRRVDELEDRLEARGAP